MVRLALRSLRRRKSSFVAPFLAMFLGATILMAFSSMLDTAVFGGASGAARETLVTMATVVGGWGLLLVVFAVTSTLTLSVRQRAGEVALLKTAGATPRQLGRMIVGEAAGLAVAAALLAVVPAVLTGRALLGMLRSTGQVPADVDYVFGLFAALLGLGVMLVSATAAALLTARKTTRAGVHESLTAAATDKVKMSRKRIVAAGLFLALALDLAVITSTVMRGKGTDAMATSGQASIFASIGLALLAPVLIRFALRLLDGPLRRFGFAGELAATNLRRRTGQAAAAVTPVILFSGISIGTLYLQATENAAVAASGLVATAEQKNLETLNFVVIGMIVLFTAISLVNTLVATTGHRRREFGQQRLAGATPDQVLRVVLLETGVLTLIGVVCGALASVFTIVPFAFARTGEVLPSGGPGIAPAIVVLAAALTGVTACTASRRALRAPAMAAATA